MPWRQPSAQAETRIRDAGHVVFRHFATHPRLPSSRPKRLADDRGKEEEGRIVRSKSWSIFAAAVAIATSAVAQTPTSVSSDDRSAIQELTASYLRALGGCRAEDFADLFVPETGYFASGFRGHMVGRDRLIALVQSERHCVAPAAAGAARPGAASPAVALEVTPTGVRGFASLGTAEYQDEYTK